MRSDAETMSSSAIAHPAVCRADAGSAPSPRPHLCIVGTCAEGSTAVGRISRQQSFERLTKDEESRTASETALKPRPGADLWANARNARRADIDLPRSFFAPPLVLSKLISPARASKDWCCR